VPELLHKRRRWLTLTPGRRTAAAVLLVPAHRGCLAGAAYVCALPLVCSTAAQQWKLAGLQGRAAIRAGRAASRGRASGYGTSHNLSGERLQCCRGLPLARCHEPLPPPLGRSVAGARGRAEACSTDAAGRVSALRYLLAVIARKASMRHHLHTFISPSCCDGEACGLPPPPTI